MKEHDETEREEANSCVQKNRGFSREFKIILCCIVFLLTTGGIFYIPNFLRAKATGSITPCQSNCKNIGTALEKYFKYHNGKYPASLSELTPTYMQNIPTCNKAERDSYSATYEISSNADAYTFRCGGDAHTYSEREILFIFHKKEKTNDLPANYPLYNSRTGLINGK